MLQQAARRGDSGAPRTVWPELGRAGDGAGPAVGGESGDRRAAGGQGGAGRTGGGVAGRGGDRVRGGRGRGGPPAAHPGQGGQPVGGPHHVAHHELGQDQGQQREVHGGPGSGGHTGPGQLSWPGRRGQHVDHRAGHDQVRQVVAAHRPQPAGGPVGQHDPPGEPHGGHAEGQAPGAGPDGAARLRRAGQRQGTRGQHAGHGHAHQHVHPVDVPLGGPPLGPGEDQPRRAVQRGQQHQRGETVRQPGRSGHPRPLSSSGALFRAAAVGQ